jgi:anti-sigma factor ChrR (cupin superfamily)
VILRELEELVALDAVGALDEAGQAELHGWLAVVDERTRRHVASLYRVAAALPATLADRGPSPLVRERLMAHATRTAGGSSVAAPVQPPMPSPGLSFVLADEGWLEHPVAGIRFKILSVDHTKNLATLLIKAAPGTVYPAHHHSAPEGCFVIDGDVEVAGRQLGPGDFHLAQGDTDHDPLRTEHGATVLLVCAASDYLPDRGWGSGTRGQGSGVRG